MWQAHYPDARTSAMALAPLSIVVWLLFAASGAAALIYGIVWQQLLQLIIGSSTVSLGVLLGMFMGGMCLGSLYAPRLVSPGRHPLRVYAALELATGAFGLLLLAAMPAIERLYTTWGGEGVAGILLRSAVAAVCVLPPTLAMGATLPVMSRWVEATRRHRSWPGLFYAGNILGAVAGCLGAGFYLLRVHDMNIATYVAVGINVFVAVAALAMVRPAPDPPPSLTYNQASFGETGCVRLPDPKPLAPETRPPASSLLVSIALSGFCAMAAEVVWTRMLSLIFGATVYTFSIVLAVFLIGLGMGSLAGSALSRRVHQPAIALGWFQWIAIAAMLWSAILLAHVLPYWPANVAASAAATFRTDFFRALLAILPAPMLWGASFPLALAAMDREVRQVRLPPSRPEGASASLAVAFRGGGK